MNTIEERVVEMRFDNKQFTSETKNTLSMLERLKAALQFSNSGKEIDKMARSVSSIRFDGIAAGVEALTNRFSTFGIVGMRVIENVTDGLMNKLTGAVNYAKNAIVSGGVKRAMNIENAHFQLQALLKDEEKVQAVMANANESVDGTAYAYDEAAKAASMFAASGIQAGDEMLGALKGITGVAAMTNAPFEAISMIFTTVAGNGRLMGDQLLQLSSRGLNAASTLSDYFKEVQKQSGMTEEKVREMVSKGQISFKTFAEAMNWAFGDSAKRANETFTGSMSNMRSALARIGAGFVSPLIEQNGVLVDMFNTLRVTFNSVKSALVFDQATSSVEGFSRALGISQKQAQKYYDMLEKQGKINLKNMETLKDHQVDGYASLQNYFNGITDGSIRASYAVTKVVEDLSKGNKVTRKDIRKFVKQGKIDFAIFSNAMEESFGSQKQKLSKRFTDFAIKNLDELRGVIESLDIAKGMDIAYRGFDSIINVAKALLSVAKPLAKAFSNVFLGFDSNDILSIADSIKQFTKRMTISEESAEKLQKTFTGVFDIVALLGDGIIELVRAFIPFGSNVKDGSDSLLDFSANLGENLSKFAQWVRTNPKVIKAFARLRYNVRTASEWIRTASKSVGEFITKIRENDKVQGAIKKTGEIFTSVGEGIHDILKLLIESFSEFNVQIYAIDLSTPIAALYGLQKAFEALGTTLMKNEGIAAIVTHLRELGYEAEHAFSVGNLQEKVEFIKKIFYSLVDVIKTVASFLKTHLGPILDEVSAGGVVATGFGFGMTVATMKIANSMETLATSVKVIPQTIKSVSGVMGALKTTLAAYQTDLKADAILKIAGAIAILAGSLVLLSLVDTKRLGVAAIALVGVGTALGFIIGKLGSLKNDANSFSVLETFARGLTRSLNNLAKAVKWKAIGSAIKDLGITIGIIAVAIAGLAYFYNKDPAAVMASFELIKEILKGLIAITAVIIIAGTIFKRGSKSFALIGVGAAALSMALLNVVKALNKLFSMEIPADYKKRISILKGLLTSVAGLVVVLGLASRMSGEGKLGALSIIAVAVLISTTVKSLQKLFKMKVPVDWPERLAMFGAIFAGLSYLMLVIGASSAVAGGGKTSFATILALAAFLYTAVSSLNKLFKIKLPDDWLVRFGMFELILISLGAIVAAVTAVGGKSETALKGAAAILAMCALLGTITMSLMVLSLIKGGALIKAAAALGVILLSLGATMAGVGRVTDASAAKAVMSMAALIGVITAALGVLSFLPVKSLVKSCAALGSILLALSLDFAAIGKIQDNKAFAGIVAMMGAMITITGLLVILSEQPWDGMLAAGAAMSAVLFGFSSAMKTLSGASGIKSERVKSFVMASLALIPMAASLALLATQPWEGILAAGVAMTMVVEQFTDTMKTLSGASGIKPERVMSFVVASLAFIPMGAALTILATQPWEGILAAGASLSLTVFAFAKALQIISGAKGIEPAKIGSFLLATLALAPIGLALGVLAHQPWDGMLAAGVALSSVIISYAAAFSLLSTMPTPNMASIGAFLLATLALAPIGLALYALSNQPWEGMMAAGAAISAVILSMSGAFAVVAVAGLAAPAAMAGIGAFLTFIAAVSAVVVAAGALNQIPGIQEFVSGGGDLLQKIGEALGKFVSGIGIGVASGLPQIGAYLNLFAMQMAMIPKKAGTGALIVAEMLLALTGASIISGLANLNPFTKSFKEMGEELVEFGGYIARFGESIKGINAGAVMAAAAAGGMLAGLYNALPKTGGWMQQILGESMSLVDFGKELLSFAPSIAAFATIVKDVKPEAVEGAAAAAELIAEIYDKLPKEGGWMQAILGESMSLAEFGNQLLLFGPSIAGFADIVKDVKSEAVEGAAAAAGLIAELYEKLPRTGGWIQTIFGEQTDLSAFGEQLDDFGEAIVGFAATVADVQSTDVEGAAAAAELIANLYDKLPQEDGWLSGLFGGDTDLTEFGDQLSSFGEAITGFAEKVKDVKVDDVTGALRVTSAMATMSKNLPSKDSLSYSDFGYQLEELGASLYRFYYNIVDLDTSKISSLSTALTKLINTASTAGKDVVTKFAKAVSNSSKSATDAVNKLMVKALNVMTKARPKFEDRGNKAATSFIAGLNSYTTNAKDAITPSIELLAKYYVQGFANGIEDNLNIATRAAAKMAKAADQAVANVLDENSPSKVAEQRGQWYNEGLVIGIEKSSDLPAKAAANAATEVTEATDKNLKVGDVIDKTSTEVGEGVKKISRALLPMSEEFKKTSSAIQKHMSGLTSSIAKAYKQIDAMAKSADKKTKQLEKDQQKAAKLEEKYNKKVEERVNWLNMSAEERKKQAKEDAKTAKIQAEAEKWAQEQVYGKAKKRQSEFLNTNATYYKNLLAVKKSGNNKMLYADKSFEEAEIDIWNRITDVFKSYTEKWTSTRDQIMDQVDFFDEVAEKETLTVDKLLQNAKSQVDVYQRYITVQQELGKKLKGTALADYIAEQGIDQTDQLEVINKMTDQQLNEYIDLYSQKMSLAGIAARDQMKDYQKELEGELHNILGGMYNELSFEDLRKLFDQGIESMFGGPRKEMYETKAPSEKEKSPGYEFGVLIGKGIKAGQASGITEGRQDLSQLVEKSLTDITKENKPKAKNAGKKLGREGSKGFETTKSLYFSAGSDAGSNLAAGLRSQAGAVRAAAEELRAAMALQQSMAAAGRQASAGMANGMASGFGTVERAAAKMAASVTRPVVHALKIHSPSLVMQKYGNYATLGFVGGLLQNLASVTKAANEISNAATDGMTTDVPRFFDDLDFNPVITPVVDMSNVTKSIDDIQSMFNNSVGTVVANVNSTAGMMNRRISIVDSMNEQTGKPGNASNSYVFNQYNQSPKALSSIDIYRNTKNQFAQFREAVDRT